MNFPAPNLANPAAGQSASTAAVTTAIGQEATYRQNSDIALQAGVDAINNTLTAPFVEFGSTPAVTFFDHGPAMAGATAGATVLMQAATSLDSNGPGVIIGTVAGGTFNFNGGRIAGSGIVQVQPGSTLVNGTILGNGGAGRLVTVPGVGSSGGLFGEITYRNLFIGIDMDCAANTTLRLVGCTLFAGLSGKYLTYSGTLVIYANCDLGGRVPTPVPVAGQPAPQLIDYRASAPARSLTFEYPLGGGLSITGMAVGSEAGSYGTATLKNVASATYYVNNVVKTLPLAVADGDTVRVDVTRTNTALGAYLVLGA